MSLVSNAIDAMFNGVSQQPANMRLPSQCEEQVNAYATVANGLAKRAPSEFLSKLSAAGFVNPFIHIINRDTTERYAVVITDEVLKVFDLADGSAKTVVFENSEEWTASTAAAVGDIVRPTTANTRLFRCSVAGTTGATEPTWNTTLEGDTVDNTATWVTIQNYFSVPAGEKPSENFEVVTVADYSFIVNKSVTVTTISQPSSTPNGAGRWYFPDNWTKRGDDSRYYTPSFGTNKGNEQTLQDLPNDTDSVPPSEGDFYSIEGNSDAGFSRYYVIRRAGVWVETHAYAGSIALDEVTMPHALVRESDGDFHVREFGWVPRLFGDDDTNPAPSFVGKTITSLGYHKNRLVMSAGENIIFSGAGDYGNFFRNTVTQLLDSDVVDVAVSTKSISQVNHILPADNGMMFFSDQNQFALNVDQLLTPSTVSIDVATSYEMNEVVVPINIGQDVFFVTETGNYSRVREYTMGNSEGLETDATDITAHVSKYLPKQILRLTGSSNEDVLFVLSSATGFQNRVYVYKFFYSGGEKVQSAWGYWEFGSDTEIKDIEILNNNLYLIIERSDGTYLEKINIQQTSYPLGLAFDVYLDKRYNFAGGDKSWDGSTYTTLTFPYDIEVAERDNVRLVHGSVPRPEQSLIQRRTSGWTRRTSRFLSTLRPLKYLVA